MTSFAYHLSGDECIDVRGDRYSHNSDQFWTTIEVGSTVGITLHCATAEQLKQLRDKLDRHIAAMSQTVDGPADDELVGELNPVDETGKPV